MSDNSRFVTQPGELVPAPKDAEVAPADRVSPLPFPAKEPDGQAPEAEAPVERARR